MVKEPKMLFEELLFKAELDFSEHPEFADLAIKLCDEDINTRAKRLGDLRRMIIDKEECTPYRMDDEYLIRFLRVRNWIVPRAHRLLVRYTKFREENPHLWRDVDWLGTAKLGSMFECVLYDHPDTGRIIIFRFDLWNPDEISLDDILQGMLLSLEIGTMQPKLQLFGGTAFIDCEGISMKHVRQFSPSYVMTLANILGLSFPGITHNLHVINCSRIFESLFRVIKRTVPDNGFWDKIIFHGYDINSLHRYVDPDHLPKRYGGSREVVSIEKWISKIDQYKNKKFIENISNLGYAVD